jgi:hypothetical protein
MNQIELSYSSSNPIFEHIDRPGLRVKLSTPPHTFLFPTPIGKSFECMQEKTVVMYAQVIANWSHFGVNIINISIPAGRKRQIWSLGEAILPRDSNAELHV